MTVHTNCEFFFPCDASFLNLSTSQMCQFALANILGYGPYKLVYKQQLIINIIGQHPNNLCEQEVVVVPPIAVS